MAYGASVAACGLAGGANLEATVLPFLLRGVNLLGIDSVLCPQGRRRAAWDRLVKDLPMEHLDAMTATAGLEDLRRHLAHAEPDPDRTEDGLGHGQ